MSTAAFRIANASVNIVGIDIRPSAAVQYGIWASSAYVSISTLTVEGAFNVWGAAISVSSWSTVSLASASAWSADAIRLAGSSMTVVTGSTAAAFAQGTYALSFVGSSSNTVTGSMISSGAIVDSDSAWNSITASSFTSRNISALVVQGSSNTLDGVYADNLKGYALIVNGSYGVVVRNSRFEGRGTGSNAAVSYGGGTAHLFEIGRAHV